MASLDIFECTKIIHSISAPQTELESQMEGLTRGVVLLYQWLLAVRESNALLLRNYSNEITKKKLVQLLKHQTVRTVYHVR